MILSGPKIIAEKQKKRITIEPFVQEQINPNSYDIRLGDRVWVYEDEELDVKKEMKLKEVVIPEEGLLLEPNRVYLANSKEKVGSSEYVMLVKGKSTTGRLGLFVTITADMVVPGEANKVGLTLHVVSPLRVFTGMRVGQVTFWKVEK